ncbi:hypothetical protein Tco_1063141 [Tanacetum coccineum]
MRYIDGKKETRNLFLESTVNGPYVMKEIHDSTSTTKNLVKRLQTVDDLTGDEKKQYDADIDAINLILLGIPNDIYNFMDACKDARAMGNRERRLMQGTDLSKQERHSRIMNDFDKFTSEVGESLVSVEDSYAAIAPKLEPGKFNKWKKRMLCYLAGMEPYYLKCIKVGPFQPKAAKGNAKPESQRTPDERRVVVQDQRLKSIIISCLPNDIMESVIRCVLAKETWTDLGLRNANDTQTLDLADIYGRFVYEDNLIQKRYSATKKALITTPSSTPISNAFFSNNVIQYFQENSNNELDERTNEEYL